MSANVQLGEFLRARRGEVSPESVGLVPQGSYRRVTGLRREEVAQLAGVSTDYYTRLEQGRHLSPSESVLDAIAGVLRLDATGRKHLADLVRATRARPRHTERQQVRPGLLRLMETLNDQPAFVLGRRTDVLAANRLARALLADFHAMPARERNLTRWILLDPAARALYRDWRTIASEMVAILRLEAGRQPDDPRTTELVGELAVKSDYDAVEALWKTVTELGRPLEVAVLNAGVGVGGAFADVDLAEDLRLIDLNVKSVVHLAKRVVVDMIPRRRGRILMTSSISATQPTPYETTYGPSRAFVYMFAESLRAEVLEHGVTVTALLPGATDSDFHARAGMGDTKFGDNSWKNDKRLVARQGVDALLAGRDAVVGGDRATKFAVLRNRFLPERVKAARQAREARPAT